MRPQPTRALRLILFACKAYVFLVPPVIWASHIIAAKAGWFSPSDRPIRYFLRENRHRELVLYCGYIIPLIVFCVAAFKSSERATRWSSGIFAMVTAIVLFFMLGAKM
jgi:hypothetical protein